MPVQIILKPYAKFLRISPDSLDEMILKESVRFALTLLNELALSIAVFCIALSLSSGVILSTSTLVGLIAIPPVGGLLVGIFAFFSTINAHQNRSARQQEIMKIVKAIHNLIAAVEKSSEEPKCRLSVEA